MKHNYTDISDLVKQTDRSPFFSYGHPEQSHSQQALESQEQAELEIEEVVEHEPDVEVEKYVEPRKETISIDKDLKKAGVKTEKTTSFPAYQKIKLPVSDETVMEGLTKPIHSSARWLAEFCIYLLKQAHLTLKKTHGKIVRVIKR